MGRIACSEDGAAADDAIFSADFIGHEYKIEGLFL